MKIVEFILLLVSCTSFLIYEKIPLDLYAIKVRNELKEIAALHSLANSTIADYNYIKNEIKYSLSGIQVKAVFFKPEMLKASMSASQSGVVTFGWEAKEGETNYISPYHLIYTASIGKVPNSNSLKSEIFDIEFQVETPKFLFQKTWENNEGDGFYSATGSIDNTYVSFKVKKIDSSCPFDESLLLEIINAFLNERTTEMNNILTVNGVQAYYKGLFFEKLVQKIYTQTSTTICNENNIDCTLESIPEYNENTGLIFKRKGKLNDEEIPSGSTFEDTSSSQKFNINKKLIQEIISKNLFNIEYEQANNPATEYELTVAYLKQIVNNIDYSDDTELKVYIEMTKVEFDNVNAISGTVTLAVKIMTKSTLVAIVNINVEMKFKLTPTLFQNGLNFVLLSKDISIGNISSDKAISDLDLLKKWIQNTYLVALGYSEYNLFALSFDLSYFFTTNKLTYEFNDEYLSIIKQ